MYTKSIDLKEFYETLQGRVVQRIIRQYLRYFWPDLKGQRVLGVGYAMPYLRPFIGEAERVACLMPMQQGAIFWPPEGKGLVSVCDEAELPIETNSVDRLLIVHAMSSAENIDSILCESWRVLAGQGSLVMIVPNRSGIWTRIDNTPFGHGTPYSLGQIRHFLKEYMFVPERADRALFFPPTSSRLMLVTAGVWEKIGHKLFNAFGGVNIVEATKQLYVGTLVAAPALQTARRRLLTAPKPISTVNSSRKAS
ncbi:MAG: methyltransferase type 11 [Proteobacteria bacterium]|nr:methyltransferase type 11 [Pseudomonadota bacterium]